MRFKAKLGTKWLAYSFSAANKKVSSLPDFGDYFQVLTPSGSTMHVKRDDLGLTISQGSQTIIASVSDTAEESDRKVDDLLKALDAQEMPVPMYVQTRIKIVVETANKTPHPEEFFKNLFG